MTTPSLTDTPPTLSERLSDHLRRVREYTTTALAAVVMIGFVWLMGSAARSVTAADPAFDRLKELISIANGIAGVVIGYYFTRTTTESVVQKAEETAQRASNAATAAVEGQASALRQVDEATQRAAANDEARRELAAAARDVLGELPQTRADEAAESTPQMKRARLERALERYG